MIDVKQLLDAEDRNLKDYDGKIPVELTESKTIRKLLETYYV
jgi:hypothetical protein